MTVRNEMVVGDEEGKRNRLNPLPAVCFQNVDSLRLRTLDLAQAPHSIFESASS